MMGESFGMQLDDDSLLALYYVMDPNATGYLEYEEVVKQLLDEDYFNMYTDKVRGCQSHQGWSGFWSPFGAGGGT